MFICHWLHWVTLVCGLEGRKESVGLYWSLQTFKKLQAVLSQSMPLLAQCSFSFLVTKQFSVPWLFKHSSLYLDLFAFLLIFPKASFPTGTLFTIVPSEMVSWQLGSSCSHCRWLEYSQDHLCILTSSQHTSWITSICTAEVCLIYTHDSEMYLSRTGLFAPCLGPISFKGVSSTSVVLWNFSVKLRAFISVCPPTTLSQSTQWSSMPHYWIVPRPWSQIPTIEDKTII